MADLSRDELPNLLYVVIALQKIASGVWVMDTDDKGQIIASVDLETARMRIQVWKDGLDLVNNFGQFEIFVFRPLDQLFLPQSKYVEN